jgi:sensor histidine kinase regulating citrate/malate metabolism
LYGVSHVSLGEIRPDIRTENLEIFVDPLLEKAFQGLFENSIVHGVHVSSIEVSCAVSHDGAIILYEDDGIGIPQGKKEAILLRVDGTHSRIRGLFFIREILDLTGITISETCEHGEVARFEIRVPKGIFRFESGPL